MICLVMCWVLVELGVSDGLIDRYVFGLFVLVVKCVGVWAWVFCLFFGFYVVIVMLFMVVWLW